MHYCKNYGDEFVPECAGVADPKYTMYFTDVEDGGLIHWCKVCGPVAHSLHDAIMDNLKDEDFKANFERLINDAENELRGTLC